MPAKAKPAQPAAVKKAKPPIKVAKPKKPAPKATKKKKAAPKKPQFTSADFERYFFALDVESFVEYTKEWNQTQLKIKIPKHTNYDQWLNYFKTLSPNVIKQMSVTGLDFLPTEAYAALSRWADIITHPGRIDKIHQSGLTAPVQKKTKSIVDLARKGDRMGVLEAVRDKLAEQLEKRATARDMAAIAREMGDVLDQIAALEKRAGPKKGTVLGTLLGEFDVKKKRPKSNGGGARNTSFKSRVTIDDMEGK